MLTHRNLVANLEQIQAAFPIFPGDTLIGVLPFFHIYGMTVIMNQGLRAGATIVTMPRFDLDQFLELIEKHSVSRAYVVPPIALALAKHPLVDQYDLSSLMIYEVGKNRLECLGDVVETALESALRRRLTTEHRVREYLDSPGGRHRAGGGRLPSALKIIGGCGLSTCTTAKVGMPSACTSPVLPGSTLAGRCTRTTVATTNGRP